MVAQEDGVAMSLRSLAIHSIDIEENLGSQDGQAQVPEDWKKKATGIAARVRPTSTSERAKWLGMPNVATHIVYVPDTSLDITEKNRVIYKTRILKILGVRNINEMDRFITIDCEETR